MPVTFSPAEYPARSQDVKPVTSTDILQEACPNQFEQVNQILQYSVGGRSGPGDTLFKIVPNENGFVNTVMTAYNHHYALVIRPDDVWLAIVSQFSFYVNANAELLRANFVAHEGKKELEVTGDIPLDFGALSRQMGELLHENVVDPDLCEWILPKFSTTTVNDSTVGAMLMMATMKKYFDYKMGTRCGIPRVTLEGERQDWELILRRLEKLKEYGLETVAWYHLLVPVITRFLRSFDNPSSPANFEFWQKVACSESYGSGSPDYSGWITAFCVFSTEGRWCGPKLDTDRVQSKAPESMSSQRFWASYTRPLQKSRPHLTLDGTEYPVVRADAVPVGYAEVDVMLDNNGVTVPCVIVAGLFGMGFSSSRDLAVSPTGKNDTIRPVVGWWMYSKLDEAEQKRRRAQARRIIHPITTHPNGFIPPAPFSESWDRTGYQAIAPPLPPLTIILPPAERREKKTRRQSLPAAPRVLPSTMQWVAGQSRATDQGVSSQPIPTSRPVHGRRNSETIEVGSAPMPAPLRRRRDSFWKRVLKF